MPKQAEFNEEAVQEAVLIGMAWVLRLSAYALFSKILGLSKRQTIGFGLGLACWTSADTIIDPIIKKKLEGKIARRG